MTGCIKFLLSPISKEAESFFCLKHTTTMTFSQVANASSGFVRPTLISGWYREKKKKVKKLAPKWPVRQ